MSPSTLPKRQPQRSEINLEHVSIEHARAVYTRLYTILLGHDVNLRSMSLREDGPTNPLITLGGCNIPTAERLIAALEKVPADKPSEEADPPEEAEA
ncbi:hypothetical protein [Streptomyces lasiicapitis]|uniref:hypothetical protein n=1 Tax=Streptomyces lasiicapitis TaxID=1923961 RepID=UPI003651F3B1